MTRVQVADAAGRPWFRYRTRLFLLVRVDITPRPVGDERGAAEYQLADDRGYAGVIAERAAAARGGC